MLQNIDMVSAAIAVVNKSMATVAIVPANIIMASVVTAKVVMDIIAIIDYEEAFFTCSMCDIVTVMWR